MGTETCALIKTNFKEFEHTLGKIIVKKQNDLDRGYTKTYFFDINDTLLRYDHVYNQIVDDKEFRRINHLTRAEHNKYFKESEKYNYTIMDSNNFIREGVPDGSKGLRLSLGHGGKAPEFLKTLCYLFGGWWMENDSENKDYVYIEQDKTKVIEWVFKNYD